MHLSVFVYTDKLVQIWAPVVSLSSQADAAALQNMVITSLAAGSCSIQRCYDHLGYVVELAGLLITNMWQFGLILMHWS